MTDVYSTEPMVETQITHIGYRHKDGKTDLVIGFWVIGEVVNSAEVEFYYSGSDHSPAKKITRYWNPTLRNTQGFLQFDSNSFEWPKVFEPCDEIYINGDHLVNLGPEQPGVYLAFCSLPIVMNTITVTTMTRP